MFIDETELLGESEGGFRFRTFSKGRDRGFRYRLSWGRGIITGAPPWAGCGGGSMAGVVDAAMMTVVVFGIRRATWGSRRAGGGDDGLSLGSEQDLDIMVRDFVESECGGEQTWCSSDSDSRARDLSMCAKKIYSLRHSVDQLEDYLSIKIRMLVLSFGETDLRHVRENPCNCACVRWSLVKLLRSSGHNAAICTSKWQASGKVPGGDHEYIDVIPSGNSRNFERIIIEIDFRCHFEIARATECYDAVLNALPVVYVGKVSRLKQFLQAMVDAAKFSLKQNSMPFPPWRSLAYLQSKWQSVYQRKGHPDDRIGRSSCFNNSQCVEHLGRLKIMLQSEAEKDCLCMPVTHDGIGREKLDGRRRPVCVS